MKPRKPDPVLRPVEAWACVTKGAIYSDGLGYWIIKEPKEGTEYEFIRVRITPLPRAKRRRKGK